MTASRKCGVFAVAFAIAYPIVYIVAMEANFALFTYHPAQGEFGFGADKPRDGGPAMYWFGWIATSAICALVIATIAAYLPDDLTRRLPAALAWVVPLLAMVTAGGLMAHFFLR
jgi:hypothetical protein